MKPLYKVYYDSPRLELCIVHPPRYNDVAKEISRLYDTEKIDDEVCNDLFARLQFLRDYYRVL